MNPWRNYPDRKPAQPGRYLVVARFGVAVDDPRVIGRWDGHAWHDDGLPLEPLDVERWTELPEA